MVINVFLLPAVYVSIAVGRDLLPAAERDFDESE
jgi:hypothetical protein